MTKFAPTLLKFSIISLIFITSTKLWAHDFDKVYVQCAVSQGNGFNWASTLSWLSAEIRQMVAKGWMENSNKKVGIDLSCFTGASSSAYVSALLDYLLSNPNLNGDKASGVERKILTLDEASQVADALQFLSLSTDFNESESFSLYAERLRTVLGINPDNTNSLGTSFWRHQANMSTIMPTFLKWVYGAYFYHPRWIDYPVQSLPSVSNFRNQNSDGTQFRFENLISYPAVGSRSEIAQIKSNQGPALDRIMSTFMDLAREKLNQEMNGVSMKGVKTIADDFCVSAFILPIQNSTHDFRYDNLKLVYICSSRTVNHLKSSTTFKNQLNKSRQMKSKILLASAKNWPTALNISSREPDLISILSGHPTQSPIGLDRVYRYSNGHFQHLPAETSPWLVLGGFPGSRLQSWTGAALLQSRVQDLKTQGYEVEGRLAIFGKTENRTDAKANFAQSTMVKYFTNESTEEVRNVLGHFYSWQDEFCPIANKLDKASKKIAVDFFRMDWNLSKTPASFFNRSYILTAKGHNLVQLQTDYRKHQELTPLFPAALSYDPRDDSQFIPQTQIMGCEH